MDPGATRCGRAARSPAQPVPVADRLLAPILVRLDVSGDGIAKGEAS